MNDLLEESMAEIAGELMADYDGKQSAICQSCGKPANYCLKVKVIATCL